MTEKIECNREKAKRLLEESGLLPNGCLVWVGET